MLFGVDLFAKISSSSLINYPEDGIDSSAQEPAISKFFKQFFSIEKPDTSSLKSNNQDFSGKAGKIIRKIDVKVLDLFGTSVYDTTRRPRSWLSKMGNMLHINTREWLIHNNLLFEEGKTLNSYELSESERILRQNSNIYDSRIMAVDIPDSPDSIDVLVLVQDVWSISGDASVNRKINQGFLSLKDINFLGLGTEVASKVKISDQYSGNWNWDGGLIWNNIKRTFFTGRITRHTYAEGLRWGIGINRDFFSPVIKWAGGIDMDFTNNQFRMQMDSITALSKLSYATFDIWAGLATDLKSKKVLTLNQNKFNFSVRVTRTNFSETPQVDSTIFQNNIFFLGRLGYAQRNYYKDRYIFGLGRTEDIPVGFITSILYGYESGRLFKRPYYGIYTGYSKFNFQVGYFYGSMQLGAYRHNGKWTQTKTGLNLLYISRLIINKQFKLRHYLWSRFLFTEDPLVINPLSINNGAGLRGTGSDKKGNKKVVFNYENNLFTPLSILGFNIAFISFADLALLSEKNESLLNSKLYKGFGLGFRIRNEHLVTGTIQIMFGYYPGKDINKFNVFEQNRSFYYFDQFRFGKPGIIDF